MWVRCAACACSAAVLLSVVLCSDDPLPATEDRYEKELYVAVGSAVDVPCVAKEGTVGQWRLNGRVLVTGAVLFIRNATLEDGGTYTCHDLSGGLQRTLSVRPGYPPSRPEVRCWAPSYPLKAMCSWSGEPEPLLPTHYSATSWLGKCPEVGHCGTHFLERRTDVQPCHPVPGLSRHCVFETRQIFSLEPYFVNVTAVNPLGSAFALVSYLLEDVVKPDPPVRVRVKPVSARGLSVEWAPPPSWPEPGIFPLKYTVQYYHGSKESARTMGPYESKSMVLKGLRPGQTYFVQVSAQDQLVGQSSDWSHLANGTLPSR
ncbi:hypothetical protein AAFF_G00238480 [Aldrovandia affinis]|uniref:Epstein-Barr virus induced 3 n=1 Tax=Aldrovandia affinis TaxID=143900 RepID=A0AAD7REK1_9TELE|nr:hypothetical protein AAFF_G00238480 [Aldrovandia affinis]